MKKVILKTIIYTAIATLIITVVLYWGITTIKDQIEASRDWKDHLSGNLECKGRIVHIASVESQGGYILYLDTEWNASEQLVQVWIYEDTVLLGEIDGKTMNQLIDERVTDIYVTTEIFPFETGIIDNTMLYPALAVTIVDSEE